MTGSKPKRFLGSKRSVKTCVVNRLLLPLLACFVLGSTLGQSPEPTKLRITTWNLEWFPNGSAHDATPEVQAQRIAAAADVLRPVIPDIILLQEVRDYDACARLGEAIAPGVYHVAICSAFKEPFQSGFGKQQVAILSKYQAQAAWSELWKSMNGVDPPRGFAFAWFKIGNEEIAVYSVHLKSNLITHGDTPQRYSIGTASYDNSPCVRNSSIKRENRAFSASTSAKINCSASIFARSRV
jgi:endonuclease/exonuclease/phosphatase family protein